MIELQGIQKRYGGRAVLDVGAFVFREGVRYALIGPNGSGKTTLLRILAGALRADEGTVKMPDPVRDGLGYMPQRPYAFGFSVLKNVLLAFKDPKSGEAPALAALEKLGMAGFASARGNRLSGGEAQRMALAGMIARPRSLLLLDEPASSADMAGNDLIEKALADYWAGTRCTLIFSTHALAQAQALADEVVMLDGGSIVESGPAERLLFRPEHPSTRTFLKHWQLCPPENASPPAQSPPPEA